MQIDSLNVEMLELLVRFLIWCVIGLGSSFIGVMLWLGRKLGERLEAIETQLGNTNKMLVEIELDLRGDIARHSSDIAVLYSRCSNNHGEVRRQEKR